MHKTSTNQWLAIHPKVGGGSIGALVATVVLWILSTYAGVKPPPEVATAFCGILVFAAGYLTSSVPYRTSRDDGQRTPEPAAPSTNGHAASPRRLTPAHVRR